MSSIRCLRTTVRNFTTPISNQEFRPVDSVTAERVRPLSLRELGIEPSKTGPLPVATAPPPPALPSADPILAKVRAALDLGFAGVIFAGAPGTGKSWYAKRIAETLAGEPERIRTVQFHTSYQYEDFMEGFAPTEGGGFALEKKTFPALCEDAAE